MTPEGRVKAAVKRRLDELPKMYRFMPVQNGMGKPGLDFFLCAGGWFLAIETKAPGGHLTERQETTKSEIEAADGIVFVVDGEASLSYAMERIKACCLLAAEIRKAKPLCL